MNLSEIRLSRIALMMLGMLTCYADFLTCPLATLCMPLALAPFAWWLLAANHSLVHTFFTYRLIAITVFTRLVWLVSAGEKGAHAG